MQKVIDKPLYKTAPPIKSEVVDVTPGMAQAWLDKNRPPFSVTAFAQGEYDRALAIFRDSGLRENEVSTTSNLAGIERRLGRLGRRRRPEARVGAGVRPGGVPAGIGDGHGQ